MRHHFLIVDKGKFKHMLDEATDTETIGVSQVLMQANGVSKNAEDADEARLLIAKDIVSNKEADMLNVRLAIHIIVTICLAAYALYLRSDGFAKMSLGAIAFAVSVACVFGYVGVRVLFSPVLEESMQNRCPGGFLATCKRKFGSWYYVDLMFRASQYDHMTGKYVKKPLGQRTHCFPDGRGSPRDLYSAFLLEHADACYDSPDRGACVADFDAFYESSVRMIESMRVSGIRVLNSGF